MSRRARQPRQRRPAAAAIDDGNNSQEAINGFLKFIASLIGSIAGVVTAWLKFKEVLRGGLTNEWLSFILLIGGIILVWVSLFYIYTKFVIKKDVSSILRNPVVQKWIGRVALFGLIAIPVASVIGLPYYKLYRSKRNLEKSTELVRLGNHYYNDEGNVDRAIELYNEALELNPNNPFAYHNLGNSYLGKGEWDKALEYINKSISLTPDKPLLAQATLNLGFAYRKKGNNERALKEYMNAIELDPNSSTASRAFSNIGAIYVDNQKYDLAIANLDQAIKIKPTNALAYKDRGRAKLEQGKLDDALNDLNTSIDLENTNAFAYVARGRIYLQKGEKVKAASDFQKAIGLSKDEKLREEAGNYLKQLGVDGK